MADFSLFREVEAGLEKNTGEENELKRAFALDPLCLTGAIMFHLVQWDGTTRCSRYN
jgi:hypothetical protein